MRTSKHVVLWSIAIFGLEIMLWPISVQSMEIEIMQPRHKSRISIRNGDNVILMLGIEDSDVSSRIQIYVNGRPLTEVTPDTDGLCGPEDFCSLSIVLPSQAFGTGQVELEALAIKKNSEVIAVADITFLVEMNNASTSCRCSMNSAGPPPKFPRRCRSASSCSG